MMALTSRTSIKRSCPSPYGRTFRLSQVFRHTRCDHPRVVPLDRIRTFPVRRTGRLGYTPVPSPFTEWNAAFGWKCHVHPIQYSRLFLRMVPQAVYDTIHQQTLLTLHLWLADRLADSFATCTVVSSSRGDTSASGDQATKSLPFHRQRCDEVLFPASRRIHILYSSSQSCREAIRVPSGDQVTQHYIS